MILRPRSFSMLCLGIASVFAGAAQAAVLTVGSGTSNGAIGAGTTPTPIPISITGDGTTVGAQFRILYDTTNINVTVAGANGGSCNATGDAGTIIVVYSDAGNVPIAGTINVCNITAVFSAAVTPPATIALDLQTSGAGDGCLDAAAANVPTCTPTDGAITVQAVNTPPTLSYAPTFDADGTSDATAEIAFTAGALNTAATATITPTATGGAATASTAIACTAAPAAFTITGGGTQTFNSPGAGAGTPIGLSVTRAAAAQAGTLTCVETDTPGGGTRTRLWDLQVPAGVVAPEVDTTPASGGTASVSGVQGSTASGGITVRNTGTGPLAVTNCAITGAGFTLGAVTNPVAAGGTGSIAFSCAVPLVPGQTITGTLQCNTDDGDEPTLNFNLSCLAISASIPTMGLGGKALLALMMLGLGLGAFQMYRRSA